jgi:hypothetical protein
LQQYGGLLGMSGSTDLGAEGMIPPMLYPQIVESLPFQLSLLNTEIDFPDFETRATVYHFFDEVRNPTVFSYVKGYTIGLPGKVIGLFREEAAVSPLPTGFETDTIYSVTKDQMEVINNMRERVSVSLNEESGVIDLYVTMPDPQAAAQRGQACAGRRSIDGGRHAQHHQRRPIRPASAEIRRGFYHRRSARSARRPPPT